MGYGSISLDHKGFTPFNEAARGKPPEPSNRLPIVRGWPFICSSFRGYICDLNAEKPYLQIIQSYNRVLNIFYTQFFPVFYAKKPFFLSPCPASLGSLTGLTESRKRSAECLFVYAIGITARPFSVLTNISGVLNISLYFSAISSERLKKLSLSNGA